jgi:GNAT superfamily N-acetyltransferase
VNVRRAVPADLQQLSQVRAHYESDGALQLSQEREGEATITTFRRIRFPRVVRIEPDLAAPDVPVDAADDEYYAVAEEGGEILAYVRALADLERGVGWITHLVVVPRHRRNHVGYTLLEAAKRWAELNRLHHLQLEVETRNLPAISFLERCGFQLAGYNEHLNRTRDIVVFYAAATG